MIFGLILILLSIILGICSLLYIYKLLPNEHPNIVTTAPKPIAEQTAQFRNKGEDNE